MSKHTKQPLASPFLSSVAFNCSQAEVPVRVDGYGVEVDTEKGREQSSERDAV